jgi:protoporphyrinogen oxidase
LPQQTPVSQKEKPAALFRLPRRLRRNAISRLKENYLDHVSPMQGAQLPPVLIVGAGMAGLACAVQLHQAGFPVRVFEAGDAVGGRVRTDEVDGFLLDRGFQVYLDAYPECGKLLDMEALQLKPFEPGALVYQGGSLHRLMDVFRRPASVWTSLRAPVGSLADKIRVGWMRRQILGSSLQDIDRRSDRTTEEYLRGRGFSDEMIDGFFRAFYGGIFLERELQTSSRMFEFTFRMFGKGSATLPARGMGEIPKQLRARLPGEAVCLNTEVTSVYRDGIELASGEWVEGSAVAVATDLSQAKKLLANADFDEPRWRSVTNLYFAADRSPVGEPIICLNGSGQGLVNNVCALTDASPEYSRDGRALMSVSLLGQHEEAALEEKVKRELNDWFGGEVSVWRHLRTDTIRRALPGQLPGVARRGHVEASGVYICGDHCLSASIEGAVVSGKQAADAIREGILSSHV